MEKQQEFHQTLKEINEINEHCLQTWREVPLLKQLGDSVSSYEVIKKVEFSAISEHLYELKFITEQKTVDFAPDMCSCFNSFQNPLKTNLPRTEYHDLTADLEVYKLLIPNEGLPLACCLKQCLVNVQNKLEELRNRLDQEARLVRTILETFRIEDVAPTYWRLNANQGLESFHLSFSLQIQNEHSVELLKRFNLSTFFTITRDLPPFTESVLVTQERHKNLMKKWIEEETLQVLPKAELLWRGSRDGFEIVNFHRLCDEKGPTILIVKANNFLFGGYAQSSWSSTQGWKSDKKSFLFSLNKETKLKQGGQHDSSFLNSIHNSPTHGPLFGASHDLYISDRANTNHLSSTCLGYSYQVPHGCQYGEHGSYLYFCGERNFQIQDIEVWQV